MAKRKEGRFEGGKHHQHKGKVKPTLKKDKRSKSGERIGEL